MDCGSRINFVYAIYNQYFLLENSKNFAQTSKKDISKATTLCFKKMITDLQMG